MNALTTAPNYAANLPEYLRDPQLFATADKVAAGISTGQPSYISIKAGKFRLVDEQGAELMVNSLTLPVVIVDANPYVSKIYYEGKYDPAAGNTVPPTCFSDNGIAASSRAAVPQSASCASCEWNAWGSKISEVSGKKIKACTDAKKVAVILASDTACVSGNLTQMVKAAQQVYLLRVPATSMAGLADMTRKVKNHGVPLLGAVISIGFDPQASYPALTFTPQGFADQALFNSARALVDGVAVRYAVGADDVPFTQTQAATQTQPAPVPPPAATLTETVFTSTLPAQSTVPAATATETSATAAAAASTAAEPAKRQRGRPRAEEAKTDGFTGAIATPQVSDAALDATLANVFA